jgi:hypothetical protein
MPRKVLQTQELTQEQLELALLVLHQLNKNPILPQLPKELRHLSPVDWEVLEGLLYELEWTKRLSSLH